jgi:hypothetical protein
MRLLKYLFCATALLGLVACNNPMEEIPDYPAITSLENTAWYSYDELTYIYYDVEFFAEEGTMVGYDSPSRENIVSNQKFTYTFALTNSMPYITLTFENGRTYAGLLYHKGIINVDFKPVYFIQLIEVDDNGETILDENGKIASVIKMWKE